MRCNIAYKANTLYNQITFKMQYCGKKEWNGLHVIASLTVLKSYKFKFLSTPVANLILDDFFEIYHAKKRNNNNRKLEKTRPNNCWPKWKLLF